MYVSVPKNYSGIAFQHKAPPTLPVTSPPPVEQRTEVCEGCRVKEKNPLTCLLEAFRGGRHSGFDNEDLLLLGLIALLINKEGNGEMVFILAMLLLM